MVKISWLMDWIVNSDCGEHSESIIECEWRREDSRYPCSCCSGKRELKKKSEEERYSYMSPMQKSVYLHWFIYIWHKFRYFF